MNHNHQHFHNCYTIVWLDLILTARFGSHPLNINHFPLKHPTIFYTGQFTYITHYLTIFNFCLKNRFPNNLKHTLKQTLPLKISQKLMIKYVTRCKTINKCTNFSILHLQSSPFPGPSSTWNCADLHTSEDLVLYYIQ